MKMPEDLIPELVVPLGHLDRLSSIAATANNDFFASGCDGGTAILWSKDGKLLRKFIGKNLPGLDVGGWIKQVSLSRNKINPNVFVSYDSGYYILWDSLSGKPLFIETNPVAIQQALFSQNGDRIIGNCPEESILVVDAKSGLLLKKSPLNHRNKCWPLMNTSPCSAPKAIRLIRSSLSTS